MDPWTIVFADITVMAPGFYTVQNLFLLLSQALHWAVLINTNGWYGCEELNSTRSKWVCIATNFATRIRSRWADSEPLFTPDTQGIPLHSLQRSIIYNLLDLERSQKVDSGTCRSQGPIRSLRLEGKRFTTRPNWGVNDYLLVGN